MENCRKGNVIQMKQKQSVEGVLRSSKPSIKNVGTMLGTGAMAVLVIGAVSVYGLTGKTEVSGGETKAAAEYNVAAVQAADEERFPATTTASVATVSWWKAGVEEYDSVETAVTTTTSKATKTTTEKSEATTTKATTKSTTTSTKKTTTKKTTTKSSEVEAIEAKTMYVSKAVNMRKGPSTSKDIITVLAAGTKVTCVGETDDGWYKVEYNGTTGYCKESYLSSKAPAKTTTAAQTTSEKTTTKKTTTTNKTTTEADTDSAKPVISYTEEEFEMMCYVLQGEVGYCSEESKIAVANVIINRVKSSRFPNTIKGVLTAPNQFTAIKAYYNKTNTPTSNTIECAKRALYGEGAEESKGATYYYAPRYCSSSTAAWFESLTFCMELEGQRFFKN